MYALTQRNKKKLLAKVQKCFARVFNVHGFMTISDAEFEKSFGAGAILFRSDAFDLMFSGRHDDISVYGRPICRKEDWYYVPDVLALTSGSFESIAADNIVLLAEKIEEEFSSLERFFSLEGADLRGKMGEWEEARYWRNNG